MKFSACFATLLLLAGCASPAPSRARARVPDLHVTSLDGKAFSLARYAGHPLWINFFATWCPPCIAEIPDLERIYRRYQSRGLVVVGIDRQESAAAVAALARAKKLTYPIAIDDGSAADALHVGTLPVSVFVRSDGTIGEVRDGQVDSAQMERSVAALLDERGVRRANAGAVESGVFALQGGTQQTRAYLAGTRLWMTPLDGSVPIRRYDLDMTKYLHAIVISDDFRTFAHVHPALDARGYFHFGTLLPNDGRHYYLYADATPHGVGKQVFRFDLGGNAASPVPRDLSESSTVAAVGPYVVHVDGSLNSGAASRLFIHITKNGRPARDLHPYLGALAHAVFINARDLTYVHAHPMPLNKATENDVTMAEMPEMPALPPNARSSPDMMLHVELTEPGTYKLWLQFRGDRTLYVAPFVLTAR